MATIKLIQVGMGGHGEYVGTHFVLPSEDFAFAGIADVDPERVEICGERWGVPEKQRFRSFQQAFEQLEAEAVLIEAASPVHYAVCSEALQRDLHVLVEKPFTLDIRQAQRLAAEAQSRGLTLMVNQNYRYYPTVRALKSAIQCGAFGKPIFVHCQFYCHHEGRSYQLSMEDVLLYEMAVHHIDMMRFLFDENILHVRADGWRTPGTSFRGNDNVHAVYELTNGVKVFYTASFAAKGEVTPWEGVWRIQCENGSIHLGSLTEGYGVYGIPHTSDPQKLEFPSVEKEGMHGILAEFANAVRTGKKPAVSAEDNVHTLAAVAATAASSRMNTRCYAADFMKFGQA